MGGTWVRPPQVGGVPGGRPYPAAAEGEETAPRRQRGLGAPPELEPSPPPASLTTFGAAPRQRQPQAQGQAERRPGQHRAAGRGALSLLSPLARSLGDCRARRRAGRPRPRPREAPSPRPRPRCTLTPRAEAHRLREAGAVRAERPGRVATRSAHGGATAAHARGRAQTQTLQLSFPVGRLRGPR